MKTYVKFNSFNAQESILKADELPGEGWVEVSNHEDGKCYKLENGTPVQYSIEDSHLVWGDQWLVDKLARVRSERNDLLAKSDWTQFPNAPLSAEKKAEWEVYRQALRDITDGITSYDQEIVWPTAS